jgi:hypothetical protein
MNIWSAQLDVVFDAQVKAMMDYVNGRCCGGQIWHLCFWSSFAATARKGETCTSIFRNKKYNTSCRVLMEL